jgi:large subunit ribosomal protein L33
MARERITLGCSECEERNYDQKKNKRLHPERVEYKKYCRRCRRHTMHKETK